MTHFFRHNYAALHTFFACFLLAYLGFDTIEINLVLVVKVCQSINSRICVTDHCISARFFICIVYGAGRFQISRNYSSAILDSVNWSHV